jgi:hypothetical protein
MRQPSIFARGVLAAAAAATVLGVLPQAAAAQPAYDDQGYDGQPYNDPCQHEQTNREIAGGLLGGIAGAVIGSNVASGGGRTGGALIGGAVGAVGGAAVGGATTDCQPGPVAYDQGPPPPPPGYDDRNGPPPGYDDRDAPPPPPCATVEDRVYFPDGSIQRGSVRACRDPNGRWYVAQ